MALSFNDLNTDTTVDESSGLQNLTATPVPAGDADDNDTSNALPADYATRLTALFPAWTSLDTALSGHDGLPGDTGDNVFTINDDGFGVGNLGFTTHPAGTPFPPLDLATYDPTDAAKLSTYVDSGIDAVDGGNVYLFIDPTNDNIVYGIDEDADLVLSVFLEEAPDLLSGKIWTTQHEAISHPDATDPDDDVDLFEKLYVTASRDLSFSLENAPAGQNLGIMFGDGSITDGLAEIGIIVTGWNPPNESEGESFTEAAFDSVNTRSGTSFGTNNQGVNEGEGLRFTFVRGPAPGTTVPMLDQNEADLESSFDFMDFFAAKGATFLIEQVVSGKTASITVSLEMENAAAASAKGDLFVDELLTNNTDVPINSLTITGLRGSNPHSLTQYSATFTSDGSDADLGITVTFIGGAVKIDGLRQGDSLGYLANFHNRTNIFNSGDGSGNDSGVVDIGSFQLLQADSVSLEVGSKVNYEDDGPGGLGSNAPVTLYEDSLTTATNPTNGNPDPAPPSQPITVQANISSLVDGGTDGLQDFGLDDTYISDLTSLNLKSGNVALVYEITAGTIGTSGGDVAGDVLTAYIGSTAGDVAFTVGITPDGDVEFKLLHAVDHDLVPPATTSDTDLIQTDIGRLFVARDNDDDPFRFAAEDVQLNMQDDAPVVDVTDGGTEPGVKYTFDGDQTGGNFQGDGGPTGTLPWNDEARDGLDKSVTTDFSGAFAFAVNPSVGADGGSVTTGYTLDLNVATGSAVSFSSGALTSGGTAVDWYEVTANQVYAGVLTGTTTEVFRISVNTTNGNVTFEQKAKFDHTVDVSSAPYTTDVLVLDDGQIDVVKTVTVADGDAGVTYEGDYVTDSASVDLGGNFGIGDDGPTADVTLTGTDLGVRYLFDGDQTGGNFQGDEGPTGTLPWNDEARDGLNTSTTLAFATAFSTAHTNGADGSGGVSTSYAIVFDTGVSVGSDVIMSGSGTAVQSGGVDLVWAAVTDGYAAVTDDASATEIFRLTINTGTGVVTFAQSGVIDHLVDVGTGPYTTDVRTLAADQLLVQRTDVVTDGESGDTATDSESVDMGGKFGIGDDGPQVAFENLTGTTLTTDPQIGDWTNSVGADVTGSVTVSLDSFSFRRGIDGTLDTGTIDSFAFNAGTGLWEGTVSGDFDNDAGTADTSIDITLELKGDGTYEFALGELFSAPTIFDTSQGQLAPGGPDAVQTLNLPDNTNVQTSIVFFGVDFGLAGMPSDSEIQAAIGVGEPDLTEAQLQALAGDLAPGTSKDGDGTYPWINMNEEPNVSTSGIGSNNNLIQGAGSGGTPVDESLVVNPLDLVTRLKIFFDNAHDYEPGAGDVLKYNAFYDDGSIATPSTSGWVTVTAGDIHFDSDEGLNYFEIFAPDPPLIDAVQFWMDQGTMRINKIEFETPEVFSADDLFFNFTGNQLDFEGDSASSSWSVDVYGQNADQTVDMADTAVVNGGADNQADDFNIDLTAASTQYTVAGFESGVDELNLLNSVGVETITTGLDLGLGGAGSDDSRVEIDGVTIDLADVTLLGTDVFLFS